MQPVLFEGQTINATPSSLPILCPQGVKRLTDLMIILARKKGSGHSAHSCATQYSPLCANHYIHQTTDRKQLKSYSSSGSLILTF